MGRIPAIPPTEATEGREPALAQALALLAPASQRRTTAGGVREAWAWVDTDDEAARKWEEFQNQQTGGAAQQKGRVQ
jgi:hypothetical protein